MTLGAALGSATSGNGDSAAAFATASPLSSHSRFAQRLRRRYAGELALLAPGAPTRATMAEAYEALRASRGFDVPAALRVLRQLVLERLMVLDCDQQAPLATVTGAVTELAEFALDVACWSQSSTISRSSTSWRSTRSAGGTSKPREVRKAW